MVFGANSDSEDEDTKVHHHLHVLDNETTNCVARKVARKNARQEQNREWRKKREMAR